MAASCIFAGQASLPNNLRLQNLLPTSTRLPPGAKSLLGLGLNFCIRTPRLPPHINRTFERFQEDLRWAHHFKFNPPANPENRNYNPKLYIKSDFKFKEAPPEIEEAVSNFESDFMLQRQHLPRQPSNLSNLHYHTMVLLKDHDNIMAFNPSADLEEMANGVIDPVN